MNDSSRAILRPFMLIGSILLATGCDKNPLPFEIEKYCVSDSGLSKYWITANTSERTGAIRYQYMGQDVRYNIKTMKIDGSIISGRAEFQSSSTGETRGNPIMFSYSSDANILTDGGARAACQNIQNN
jgi:hypothetical protein